MPKDQSTSVWKRPGWMIMAALWKMPKGEDKPAQSRLEFSCGHLFHRLKPVADKDAGSKPARRFDLVLVALPYGWSTGRDKPARSRHEDSISCWLLNSTLMSGAWSVRTICCRLIL